MFFLEVEVADATTAFALSSRISPIGMCCFMDAIHLPLWLFRAEPRFFGSSRLESFLARLYTDPEMRARFLADADTEARQAGLSPTDHAAVLKIDPIQLRLAARSFAHKRRKRANGHSKPSRSKPFTIIQRWMEKV